MFVPVTHEFCLHHALLGHLGPTPVNLSESASIRFSWISFYLLVFLICCVLIKNLWYFLRVKLIYSSPEFTQKTFRKLSLKKTVTRLGLTGIVFFFGYSLYSSTIGLNPPGRARKENQIKELQSELVREQGRQEAESENRLARLRQFQLEKLKGALWFYALNHQGKFPESMESSGISEEEWFMPELYQIKYQYQSGLTPVKEEKPLVLVQEVNLYGDSPLVLMTDGTVKQLPKESKEKQEGESK